MFLGDSAQRTLRGTVAREQGAADRDEMRRHNALTAAQETDRLLRSVATRFCVSVEDEVEILVAGNKKMRNTVPRDADEIEMDLGFSVGHLRITGACGRCIEMAASKPTCPEPFLRHVPGCKKCTVKAETLNPGIVAAIMTKYCK